MATSHQQVKGVKGAVYSLVLGMVKKQKITKQRNYERREKARRLMETGGRELTNAHCPFGDR